MLGTVREWDEELGWGTIAGDEMPETHWIHFDADTPELHVGDRVRFDVVGPVDQDGFRFKAASVRPA